MQKCVGFFVFILVGASRNIFLRNINLASFRLITVEFLEGNSLYSLINRRAPHRQIFNYKN